MIGPLAVLVARLTPEASASAVAAALIAMAGGGFALGALPDAGEDPAERRTVGRRRQLARAVMIVALVSTFLIVRTGG
jgi:hypothetical protein